RGSGTVTAIDAGNNSVAGMVELNGHPEFAVSDGRGSIYVNLDDSSVVVRFDARTLQVQGRWSLAPCEGPSGLAMDQATRRLFAVCGNKLIAVMNADDGRVIPVLPIGDGTDGVAFDPGTKL